MQDYAVHYTPRAKRRLKDIIGLIFSTYSNPLAAFRFKQQIETKCKSLSNVPRISNVKTVRHGKEFRYAHIKNYTIIYYIDEHTKTVHIYSIEYSHRNIIDLLG